MGILYTRLLTAESPSTPPDAAPDAPSSRAVTDSPDPPAAPIVFANRSLTAVRSPEDTTVKIMIEIEEIIVVMYV